MVLEKGCLEVYTGNGKGKTTTAIGIAVRAAGAHLRVMLIQFMKAGKYSEIVALSGIEGIDIEQFGRGEWVDPDNPDPLDVEVARLALERAKEVLHAKDHDLVILDELNVALSMGLLDIDDVMDLLRSRPDDVEMVITGRNAHEKVIEMADLVTSMDEVKHPYNSGVPARKGIEY